MWNDRRTTTCSRSLTYLDASSAAAAASTTQSGFREHPVRFIDTVDITHNLQDGADLSGIAELEVELHHGDAIVAGPGCHADDVHSLRRHCLCYVDQQVHPI